MSGLKVTCNRCISACTNLVRAAEVYEYFYMLRYIFDVFIIAMPFCFRNTNVQLRYSWVSVKCRPKSKHCGIEKAVEQPVEHRYNIFSWNQEGKIYVESSAVRTGSNPARLSTRGHYGDCCLNGGLIWAGICVKRRKKYRKPCRRFSCSGTS